MLPWSFIINPILAATEDSYPKARIISTVQDSALFATTGVPFITAMQVSYHPIHLNYLAKHDAFIAQGGSQESETLSVKQYLQLLSNSKIRQWDVAIQNVYPLGSKRYKELFPNHRIPFQSGKQSDRIAAVSALNIAIGSDTEIVPTKDDVELFFTQMNAKYSGQQGSIHHTSVVKQQLEAARVAMAEAQFGNLGTFIHEYKATPELLLPYFDVKNIRSHNQVLFSHILKALQDYCLFKHTFGKDDEVAITNPNGFPLKFFKAALKTNKIGETFYIAPPEARSVITAGDIGDLNDKFMKVLNPSETEEAHFEFELL